MRSLPAGVNVITAGEGHLLALLVCEVRFSAVDALTSHNEPVASFVSDRDGTGASRARDGS